MAHLAFAFATSAGGVEALLRGRPDSRRTPSRSVVVSRAAGEDSPYDVSTSLPTTDHATCSRLFQPHRRLLLSSVAASVAVPNSGASPIIAVPTALAAAATSVPPASTPLKHSTVTPSTVIKGCWQLSGGHRGDPKTDRTSGSVASDDFAPFVRAGVDTFDTGPEACGYGPSEQIIGDALKRGIVKRSEVNIFTKMCCVGREQQNMTRDWVSQKLDLPMRRLGVDSLDLIQLYWNDYGAKNYVDCALFLTEAKAAGRIGAVGLTNFDTKRVREMVDAGAEISSNQIQFSLLDRRPELEMEKYCVANGIALLPYGVVAGGLLSDQFLNKPADTVVLDTSSKRKYASVLGYAGGYGWLQNLLAELRRVGDKHGGASIANVATKWVLGSAAVPAVILGARNATHVEDYKALFSFELDDEDRAGIRNVLDAGKAPTADCYTWERGGRW